MIMILIDMFIQSNQSSIWIELGSVAQLVEGCLYTVIRYDVMNLFRAFAYKTHVFLVCSNAKVDVGGGPIRVRIAPRGYTGSYCP